MYDAVFIPCSALILVPMVNMSKMDCQMEFLLFLLFILNLKKNLYYIYEAIQITH